LKQINASIITIGDELLIGQTIDTNSAWIGQELNKIGVWLKRRVAVGDVWDDIWNALDAESKESDIIIITGGLGPTADDITKPLLCKYFGGKLIVNEEVLAHVKYLFDKVYRRPGPMLESNLKQAEVPDVCTVLHNARGTAPGMWFGPPTPQRGELKSGNLKQHLSYATADPITYGLLKEFVTEHRSIPTEAEKVLWEIVRGKKMAGFKFRRQHIISNYIADFVCLSGKLIIEVDGLHHQLPENKANDEVRTKELKNLGFDVIRFTKEQILNEPDQVINVIIQRSKQKRLELSTTQSPPLGGRGAVFVSLPGVPHEMKGLMINEVLPRIEKTFELPFIIHRTAFTMGTGESMIAEKIKDFEASLPEHIKLAYLPGYGMVKLRLTAKGDDKEKMENELDERFSVLKELVNEWLVSDEDENLAMVVQKILKAKNKTIGTAESCTGGYIAHLITSNAGSSVGFKGSIISYANDVKERVLGVTDKTLRTVGAVSEETVRQMAKGAIEKLQVDFVVATSGIMGPDGGTDEKPVGTVWVAVGNKEKIEAVKLAFRFDRERNIEMTSHTALNLLRKFILANT
jgi:PncC family amidohydrolase